MDELEVRDLFAMFAMCGQMANAKINPRTTYDELAEESYELADAMLKAREYQEPEEGIAAITKRKR